MLRINFLGHIAIYDDSQSLIDKFSNKSIAILAILIMSKDKVVSRNQLLSILWPESSEDAAKYNLRFNLWQLRKNIGLDENGEAFIIVTKDYCSINEKYQYTCDVKEIVGTDAELASDINKLTEVGGLFEGEFFDDFTISGCDEFLEFVMMQRYSLENKKLSIYKRLIELYYNSGNEDKCLELIMTFEELDPYDESMALKRLQILINENRYREAMRFYQGYCNTMMADLGLEPSKEIKAVIGGIKRESKESKNSVRLKVKGFKSVECYLMADILKALMEEKNFEMESYLSQSQIRDLAYIQYRLGDCNYQCSISRVVDAFSKLILRFCANNTLEIKIENADKVDDVSKEILEDLKEKCGNRLNFN